MDALRAVLTAGGAHVSGGPGQGCPSCLSGVRCASRLPSYCFRFGSGLEKTRYGSPSQTAKLSDRSDGYACS